ncbi:MAG: CoB--CoM heterodisulfide reductase iron-sulfur subunit A family protein [Deltaproteobacteria bacterium]|nr:CoB--CoM heterodisulfide reductase iron-sulfur subunit A family protein [Deltaproteobacteria bacterium]
MNQHSKGKIGSVMVVGGGIGGIQASLDLAEAGFYVHLVESSPSIGGVMPQLDKTFPTNDCSMCILSPKLVECGKHLNIRTVTNAEVTAAEGGAGDFSVAIRRRPRYIDMDECTGCGICASHCPISAIDTFNRGLSRRTAVYIDYPQAVPLAYAIDSDRCIGCGLCARVCPAGAVRYTEKEEDEAVRVGAIILAPGYEVFNAGLKGEYGYGIYPNVVTGIEFERMLSASGPFGGHIQRPFDKKEPGKIAFIQCVGSRDPSQGIHYCSSACCMYATKEAMIAKEHLSSIEPTIFYMDIRAHGKGFDQYYERAVGQYGVRYIRCMVSSVKEMQPGNDLLLRYVSGNGSLSEEIFDLVVLSVGFRTPERLREMSRRLGVELDEHGFCKTSPAAPMDTTRPGIFAAGVFTGPKDIPETVMQASAVASRAAEILAPARNTLVKSKEIPAERDIRGEPERIGVFVCHCGINIGGVVNVPEVAEYARSLPRVEFATDGLYTCSQDFQKQMRDYICRYRLNRVVVASCSPRTHEPLFQDTLREAGLNPYLFEMANIRDQDSWVHMDQPEKATDKAKDLVRMAVYKARRLQPLAAARLPVTPTALVVGGGVAGMTAALSLARQGFTAHLVEKENELGGNFRRLRYTLEMEDVRPFLDDLTRRVLTHENIRVRTGTQIAGILGFVGNFRTTLEKAGGITEEVEHGVVIVATGGRELETDQYLRGKDERVLTQLEMEERLAGGDPAITRGSRTVVMIQCVGSRDEERPYCSRYCCGEAVKNALRLKRMDPTADVLILYRDIRTYGTKEVYYHRAREAGVRFVPYERDRPPRVEREGDRLMVSFDEPALGIPVKTPVDFAVLSVATVAHQENRELARFLKIPLTDEGFFLEAHMKLRPVDFATEGVFMCGLAHGPKFMEESIAQALAAAARAATVLTRDEIEAEGKVAHVIPERCMACRLCELNCPFGAIEVDNEKGVAVVNEVLCKGCGVCAASCRSNAVDVKGFSNQQILDVLEGLLARRNSNTGLSCQAGK